MDGKTGLTDAKLEEILMQCDSDEEIFDEESSEEDRDVDKTTCGCNNSNDDLEEVEHKKRKHVNNEDKWTTAESFTPTIHNFDIVHSGSTKGNATSTELECFKMFFSETIMTEIANQTNLYFQFVNAQNSSKEKSRLKRWKDTDFKELYCFSAINLLMSQVKKTRLNDYWSQEWLRSTPAFAQIMSRDSYLLLLRLLHFTDNTSSRVATDSLRKIRIIVDHLKHTFRETFIPYQNICIDESLMLFKGRLFFKQYIPSKRHRFGIKLFMCDCKTGYILDFIIYTGVTTEIVNFDIANLGKSGNTVLTLISNYLNKGYTLYVDR
ncbi:piggyBac transposable element-derived protein 4-like [Diorhabda sublineata]|uniref:piggyBac transposable element-derived protein 4-like n=1 Tax=Diorhabda sublineata TaxID=1163346 RepID=UPI0024E058E3|nr:piggyBac transposable element-derived protein 4-like [Diorhabda sublineata]